MSIQSTFQRLHEVRASERSNIRWATFYAGTLVVEAVDLVLSNPVAPELLGAAAVVSASFCVRNVLNAHSDGQTAAALEVSLEQQSPALGQQSPSTSSTG